MQPAEGDRRGDGELALRLALRARDTRARRIELGEDAAAGLQIVAPGLRQRELARRAVYQPYANNILERGQVPADRGQRHRKTAPRS